MNKRVTLKFNHGSLEAGFSVTLQVGNDGAAPTAEISGSLPTAPSLKAVYLRWQVAYRQLGVPTRISINPTGFATNVSIVGDCHALADELKAAFNQWLRSESFRPIQEKLLESLTPTDSIRLVLQTSNDIVQRLPWHLWAICDRYPKLETALSAPTYEQSVSTAVPPRQNVRILAILGHSEGLDIETDRALLNHLPHADIHVLSQPTRQILDAHLWDPEGWDILFFAGHSVTECREAGVQNTTEQVAVGKLFINPTDSITIPQLKNALRKALTRGLKIAIFNSCDGLGLAQALADLRISQVLVMREPIPDAIAHTFLKSFLEAFSRGESFYLAVREAREKLQALEDNFPCASWLPTIYQNPAETPPTWQSLSQLTAEPTAQAIALPQPLRERSLSSSPHSPLNVPLILTTHVLVTALLLLCRTFGLFQSWEISAFDRFLRLRPKELPDPRLVVITITEADVQAQNAEDRRGSLSDVALSNLLEKLEPMQPRAIGLDVYRDFPALKSQPQLAADLANTNNLFVVCKSRDQQADSDGIAPPPEVPSNRVGFSDFVQDGDEKIRRQVLSFTPEPASPCTASYGLATLLALSYLEGEGISASFSPEGDLSIGDTRFKPLEADDGGYRGVDAKGYQLLLNYRNLDRLGQIADQVTLMDMLNGQVSPEAIRDRIVLIGTTASSYRDHWLTPYSPTEGKTKGVFMQAQMTSHLLSAVLDNRPLLKTWPEWQEMLWISVWAAVGSALMFTLGRPLLTDSVQQSPSTQRPRQRSPAAVKLFLGLLLSELGLFGLCWLLFSQKTVWVPWVPAAIAPIAVASSTPLTRRFSQRFFDPRSSSIAQKTTD